MKLSRILVSILVVGMFISCTTVQPIWDNIKSKGEAAMGKALLKVGEMATKGMSETTGRISDVTPFITIANVNRARPFMPLELQFMEDNGITPPEEGSYVSILFSRGMKLLEIDGSVSVNGNTLTHYGNGMHLVNMPVESGGSYEFTVDGSEEEAVTFTETFSGETIEILEPASGSTIDLSKGFDLKWTPAADSNKRIKVSMFFTQIGLQNILPFLLLEDTGEFTVTPEMLAEGAGPGQNYLVGESVVMLERISEEVRYLFNGDAVVTMLDVDAVEVTTTGDAPKKEKDVIPAITATEGDVTVTIHPVVAKYNPGMAAVAKLDDIESIGLATFVFTGVTGGAWETTETQGNYKITTTKRWGRDFGVPVLTQLADHMADGLMAALSLGLGAEEVAKAEFKSTMAYKRMASLETESNDQSFQVNARELANLSSWRNIQVRIGGTTSWYYDMAKVSGTDAFVQCYVDANRHEPTTGEWDDFVFDVSINVGFMAFPYNTLLGATIPGATASYTSEKITITEATTYAELLSALKVEDFLVAYASAWNQWAETYKTI